MITLLSATSWPAARPTGFGGRQQVMEITVGFISAMSREEDQLFRHISPAMFLSGMAQKSALVTGIGGQDGYYLSCHLLSLGYSVHGLARGPVNRRPRLTALRRVYKDRFMVHSGDILDLACLLTLLDKIRVDEIFHLAAQSHVALSFEQPLYTFDTNALGTMRLLEAITVLKLTKTIRFYNVSGREGKINERTVLQAKNQALFKQLLLQACTSEVFGQVVETPQTETTLFQPVSPYGASKALAYFATKIAREQHQMYAVSGILFNHESPLRDESFVTRKITLGVARIAHGLADDIQLGHLDSARDWTHARDMARGIHLMITQKTPRDLVLASGQSRSVRQFVEAAFDVIGMPIKWQGHGLDETGYDACNGKIRIRVDPSLFRPLEIHRLQGDARRAAEVLSWRPTISFLELVREMVNEDLNALALTCKL